LVTANKAGYQIGFFVFLNSWVGLYFDPICA
jgi:tetrahydromethanopterin S-methyltransferase subunit E